MKMMMKLITCSSNKSSPYVISLIRRFSVWSMKKDPDLELALTHDRRWIVNNQIKNIILRHPNQVAPIDFIQKKFKTLDMRGKARNWLKKYPCFFEVFRENNVQYCRLTKMIMSLVEQEESIKDEQEPVFVERLAKILMLAKNHKLNVGKLDELKRNYGFPDDYLIRIVPKNPEIFRLVNYGGRKSSLDVELISWNKELAVSRIEEMALEKNTKPCFSCSLPSTWIKSWERFNEFNSTPYISPYTDPCGLDDESWENEKRAIALVHELLSLSLWKKISIMKLAHFKKEFALPDKLNVLLLKQPGIFYVTNKYKIYTALLREAYSGSKLIHKDPLVMIKDQFGELMQEGLHEYNQRRRLLNQEKRKKMGVPLPKEVTKKVKDTEMSEDEEQVGHVGRLFDPEERKRFYKILFDEDS